MVQSNKYTLSASILAADFLNISENIKNLKEFGCNEIHFDVMDGRFVEEISMGPIILKSIKKAIDLPIDVHLMVNNPEKNIEQFSKLNVQTITFHYEATHDHKSIIELIKSKNIKVGIAINPSTDVNKVFEFIHEIDRVLIMCVNPGFSGQKFDKKNLDKIKKFKDFLITNNLIDRFEIGVDGGVNVSNIKDCYEAGANVFISGSSIFWNGDVKSNIMSLYSSIGSKNE
tara:strand:+ start:941 stop:1627 length:687 start_codon:yes stop_codon:yes gene_type:complete